MLEQQLDRAEARGGGGNLGQLRQQALGGVEGQLRLLQQLLLLLGREVHLFKAVVQLVLEAGEIVLEGPEAHGRQIMAAQDGVGLLRQLLAAGEIAAVAHIHVGHEAMGGLARQHLQLLQPDRGSGRGGRGLQGGEHGQIVLESGGAAQGRPGDRAGAKGGSQLRPLLLQQGVGRRQSAHQRRQLPRRGLTLEQRPGEHHALGLVVRLADAGMQLAHPRPEALTQLGISRAGVIGDRGDHQHNRDNRGRN